MNFWNLNFSAIFITFYPEYYVLAFALGLLTDLFIGGMVGFTAVFNLLYLGAIAVFKKRFAFNWYWAIIFIILSQVLWSYVWQFNF